MQKIEGKTITLTKGDTFKSTIKMFGIGGRPYTPEQGDVIRFHMKQNYGDAELLIEKIIPNDTLLLKLDPTDTSSLNVGNYVFDIQITYANGDVDTFIDRGTLTLTEEVEGTAPPTPPVVAGMTFESGEWTPTSDRSTTNITFQNEHSEPPVFVAIIKKGDEGFFPMIAYEFFAIDWNRLFGHGEYIDENTTWYGFWNGAYANNAGTGVTDTGVTKFTATTGNASFNKFVTSTGIQAAFQSKVWCADYNYEWFAAWMPET